MDQRYFIPPSIPLRLPPPKSVKPRRRCCLTSLGPSGMGTASRISPEMRPQLDPNRMGNSTGSLTARCPATTGPTKRPMLVANCCCAKIVPRLEGSVKLAKMVPLVAARSVIPTRARHITMMVGQVPGMTAIAMLRSPFKREPSTAQHLRPTDFWTKPVIQMLVAKVARALSTKVKPTCSESNCSLASRKMAVMETTTPKLIPLKKPEIASTLTPAGILATLEGALGSDAVAAGWPLDWSQTGDSGR